MEDATQTLGYPLENNTSLKRYIVFIILPLTYSFRIAWLMDKQWHINGKITS